ncbi:cysteine synthase family protein [Tritrichomonas foetus]|uniref:Cysteine synthase family protein n=1 Tax=Tritrichomonas foetus TaxID=1144522 RepID=A0A1J4JN84_9EUKA|nr:cysteine synthase family protein [Tritrichomonas foetus]|eukprot:OHT00539.1 cysteine synthase family protein [Tritrichomonas foetus]
MSTTTETQTAAAGLVSKRVYDNVLGTIGNTPVVRLHKIVESRPDVEVYAKLEGFNATGSVKDRIALRMLEQAEEEGKLHPGSVVIEATSGNTGIGLSMIARVKGYKMLIVMPESVSIERRKMIYAFGGEIVLTPASEGTDGAIRKVRQMVKENPEKYFNPDQFSNEYNKLAHYRTTAEEIWEQSKGRITHFVSSLGTSGTIMGVGRALKEKNPNIKIIEAQPIRGHYIQGLKNMKEAIVPAIYNPELVDEHVMIESEEAFDTARKIVSEEGIFVGMSSGAAMLAVLKVLPTLPAGSVVFVIFPDRGEKYLSTKLFQVPE